MGKLTRTREEQSARINTLGGYQHVFNAIADAAKPWPSKEQCTGLSVSVFAFIDTLDGVETDGRAALAEGEVS